MNVKFNFSGLTEIYAEAARCGAPTVVFELTNGRGRFVYMMFFAEEDEDSRDRLFIYLRNTNALLQLKMYGSHRNGTFIVYVSDEDQERMIAELLLQGNGAPFGFEEFLHGLNNSIPKSVPLQRKLDLCRQVWPHTRDRLADAVDDADRVYLIGPVSLPTGKKPREKTLRKLYFYTNADAATINTFIDSLKKSGKTLAWTNDPDRARNLSDIMRQ